MNLFFVLARYASTAISKSETVKKIGEQELEFLQTPGFQKFKKKVGIIFILVIAIALFLTYLK